MTEYICKFDDCRICVVCKINKGSTVSESDCNHCIETRKALAIESLSQAIFHLGNVECAVKILAKTVRTLVKRENA